MGLSRQPFFFVGALAFFRSRHLCLFVCIHVLCFVFSISRLTCAHIFHDKQAAQSSTAHVDLSKPVLQFLTRLQDRGEVLEGMFGPFINPVKRSNLPDFVFPGGRPVSTKKRRKKSMTSNGDSLDDPPKKRLHLEDQVEDVVELEASSSTTSGNAGPSNPPLGTTKKPKISLGDA